MIPIAFVDDYKPIRILLIRHLNHTKPNTYQFYEYEDGQDFIDRLPTQNYTPALVLMDISMPRVNGYDATAWLKQQYPTVPVLIFTDIDGPDALVMLVRSGANGHCKKHEIDDEGPFNDIMERMMAGEEHFKNPALHAFAKKRMAMPLKQLFDGIDSLTAEEKRLVSYLAYHKTYNDKAKEQFVSPSGYKKRLGKVFKKLKVNSTEALIKHAVRVGLIKE